LAVWRLLSYPLPLVLVCADLRLTN